MRFIANNFTAEIPLVDFDLSWNKSLRAIEVPASSIDDALRGYSLDVASGLLTYALSTIRSPEFHKVCVLYREKDFGATKLLEFSTRCHLRELSQGEKVVEASQHYKRFELLRGVHKVRDFRLELRAGVWDPDAEYVVRMLKEAVAAEEVKGGFNDFFSEPTVTFVPRAICDLYHY